MHFLALLVRNSPVGVTARSGSDSKREKRGFESARDESLSSRLCQLKVNKVSYILVSRVRVPKILV